MEYGYVRVSSRDQNIARQMDEMRRFGIPESLIFIDKQSGKNFERSSYLKLIKQLREGDVFVVKSIDRLGRDYQMVIDEWRRIVKVIHADIVVLDMPILDTRERKDGLVSKFISDLVLQILSFVAQNKRENIKERQAEGIKLAKERGVRFGRPKKLLPSFFEEAIDRFAIHQLTAEKAAKLLGVSKTTFFRLVSKRNQNDDRSEAGKRNKKPQKVTHINT